MNHKVLAARFSASYMPKSIHTGDYQLLVGLLREYRLAAGLTQIDLATRLNRKQAFVSAVEVEGRRLDLLQLREWTIACGVDLVSLVQTFEARKNAQDDPTSLVSQPR
ncbi:helix-turn-helix domain-containing protein [Pseudomonas sp. LB3P81]